MPDYFDRLLARYAPAVAPGAAGAGGAGRPVRVRPRLPGPYERIESLRGADPSVEEAVSLVPAGPRPAPRQRERVLREREVRTEHHTVVRTESAPRDNPERPATVPPTAPVLRPAAPLTPVLRPAARGMTGRPRGAQAADAPAAQPRTAAAPLPRSGVAAPVTATAAVPLRPRSTEAAAAREAARATAARRRPRSAERVVHVQIGRLEVSTGGAAGSKRRGDERPAPSGRPAPALSLEDYLTRGERRD